MHLSSLLTWRRARNYAVLPCLVYLCSWAYFTLGGSPPLNRVGDPIGGDYIAFHTAGRMVLQGEAPRLYDRAEVTARQWEATAGRIPRLYDPLRNPPFFALLFVPLAALDLVPSYAAWTLLSLGCLALAGWLAVSVGPGLRSRWRGLLVITAGFAPVYLGLVGGQNSTLALLLYVLIYRALLLGRTGEAAAWAALGLYKPQLFILFPVVFLAGRQWRALGVYAIVAVVLGLVSLGMVGADGLLAWTGVLFSNNLEGGIVQQQGPRMHSLKALLDLLMPASPAVALALSATLSGALATVIARVWHSREAWHPERLPIAYSLTVIGGLLVNPHLFDYDMTLLLLPGVILATAVPAARWWLLGMYVLLFMREPIPLGEVALQPTVLLLAAFVLWLVRQYK